MWGSNMLAHYSCRCNELFNSGNNDGIDGELFGGLKMIIFTGDLKQLQPVLDRTPYTDPATLKNPTTG